MEGDAVGIEAEIAGAAQQLTAISGAQPNLRDSGHSAPSQETRMRQKTRAPGAARASLSSSARCRRRRAARPASIGGGDVLFLLDRVAEGQAARPRSPLPRQSSISPRLATSKLEPLCAPASRRFRRRVRLYRIVELAPAANGDADARRLRRSTSRSTTRHGVSGECSTRKREILSVITGASFAEELNMSASTETKDRPHTRTDPGADRTPPETMPIRLSEARSAGSGISSNCSDR